MLWIANLLIIVGLWSIGYKWRHSFLFSIAGEALYTYVALSTKQWELGFICIVFCLLAFRNWCKWAKS